MHKPVCVYIAENVREFRGLSAKVSVVGWFATRRGRAFPKENSSQSGLQMGKALFQNMRMYKGPTIAFAIMSYFWGLISGEFTSEVEGG